MKGGRKEAEAGGRKKKEAGGGGIAAVKEARRSI